MLATWDSISVYSGPQAQYQQLVKTLHKKMKILKTWVSPSLMKLFGNMQLCQMTLENLPATISQIMLKATNYIDHAVQPMWWDTEDAVQPMWWDTEDKIKENEGSQNWLSKADSSLRCYFGTFKLHS